MDGLGSKNYGCLINFGNDEDGDPTRKLIAWNMVLKGGITGMQVWSERNEFRNLAAAFNDRKKTNTFLISSLNVMNYEMFGDVTQFVCLVSYLYCAKLKQEQVELKKNNALTKVLINEKEEASFEGEKHDDLTSNIDLI